MKEDVLRFRKCVEMLKSEKGYTNEKLCKELGISDPTLFKLMTIDLTELKGLRASTLGIIQDFMKAHCNDINYAGIEPLEITPENKEKVEAAERLSKHPYFKGKTSGGANDLRPEKEKKEVGPEQISGTLETTSNPFALLLEALKSIPSNVRIQISINDK